MKDNIVTVTEFTIPKEVHGGIALIHDNNKYFLAFATEYESVYIPITEIAYNELLKG